MIASLSNKESRRANPVPSLRSKDSEASSLIDVDSPHVQSVKSDFEDQVVKTETQAARLEREAEDKARAAAKAVQQEADSLKKKAATKGKEIKKELKKDGRKLEENKDNPVVIGNALLWTLAVVGVGVSAYQKHAEGKLDLKAAGQFAGILAAIGVADYFGSRYVRKHQASIRMCTDTQAGGSWRTNTRQNKVVCSTAIRCSNVLSIRYGSR